MAEVKAEPKEIIVKTKGKKAVADEDKKEKVVIQLGPPNVGADENVFAVAHIFASWNGTAKLRTI